MGGQYRSSMQPSAMSLRPRAAPQSSVVIRAPILIHASLHNLAQGLRLFIARHLNVLVLTVRGFARRLLQNIAAIRLWIQQRQFRVVATHSLPAVRHNLLLPISRHVRKLPLVSIASLRLLPLLLVSTAVSVERIVNSSVRAVRRVRQMHHHFQLVSYVLRQPKIDANPHPQ